jgi:hypothetical protein
MSRRAREKYERKERQIMKEITATSSAIRRSLARRMFGDLVEQGNRFAIRGGRRRFMTVDAVLEIFEQLTPDMAMEADRLLDSILGRHGWLSRWKELADALAPALAEFKRTLEALKGSPRTRRLRREREARAAHAAAAIERAQLRDDLRLLGVAC